MFKLNYVNIKAGFNEKEIFYTILKNIFIDNDSPIKLGEETLNILIESFEKKTFSLNSLNKILNVNYVN
jgi:hypothetical protein